MKNITYAVHRGTGLIYSRVGSEIAFPVLDYAQVGANGDYIAPFDFHLEKCPVFHLAGHEWRALRWTKIQSKQAKNHHRAFWGLPALP